MRVSALFTVALSALATLTSAKIEGIAVPKTIAPGSTFRVIIQTANYIQSVQDVSMSFGISLQPSLDTLGPYFLDSKFLGPDNSNILTNITHLVTVPTALKKGTKVYFVAALTSLFGAGYSPTLTHYQVPVKVGDFTSNGDLVSSLQH